MISALILPILLGFGALAVDVGSYAAHRRSLQNDADAIALAAARNLPDVTAAQNAAQTWAADNGLSTSDYNLSITGGSVTPKVSVDVHRSHAFSFIGYLGVGSKTVGAHAAAQRSRPVGIGGPMPWAITQDAIDQAP